MRSERPKTKKFPGDHSEEHSQTRPKRTLPCANDEHSPQSLSMFMTARTSLPQIWGWYLNTRSQLQQKDIVSPEDGRDASEQRHFWRCADAARLRCTEAERAFQRNIWRRREGWRGRGGSSPLSEREAAVQARRLSSGDVKGHFPGHLLRKRSIRVRADALEN